MSFSNITKVDLIYVGAVVVLIVLLGLLTLSGSSFAELSLLFVTGGLLGYGLAHMLTYNEAPRWARAISVWIAAIVLSLAGLLIVSLFINPAFADRVVEFFDLNGRFEPIEPIFYGFGLAFLSSVFRRVTVPSLYPATREEAQGKKQKEIKNIVIVGGAFLTLIAFFLLIYGFLYLIGWITTLFAS